ncbi:MAG: PEP-CTERM sorting domain-containing protein [Gammaproteobacteria bacterium]
MSTSTPGDLTVTLYNTGAYDVTQPSDILQAVYWSMASNVSLQLVSATTAAQVQFTSSGNHKNGGGNYTESSGQTYMGAGLDGKYSLGSPIAGIGSAGLGNFGNTVGGGDYGILPTAWNPDKLDTYNGGMVNNSPYAQGHVTFHLKATTANGSAVANVGALGLEDVKFQWGTSPDLVTVPAPSTLALMPLAIGLMAAVTRKRRRRT